MGLRDRLRKDLLAAMKERDHVATRALRSAISAIENAEAVDAANAPRPAEGPIAGAVVGIGRGDVPRRLLAEDDVVQIVHREIGERESVATLYDRLGRREDAEGLRAEASVLVRAQAG